MREREKEGGRRGQREGRGTCFLEKTEMIKEKHVTKGHIVQYFFIVCVCVCVCVCVIVLSHPVMSDSFALPQTAACHAPLPMGLPRQKYWWVAISSPRVSSWPKDRTSVFCSSCNDPWFFTTEPPWKPLQYDYLLNNKPCNVPHSKWEGLGDWVLTQFLPSLLKENYRR